MSPSSKLHLEALQCHFTWDLISSRITLLRLRDKLHDICPDESNPWKGHIDNLLGFLQTRLGCSDDAVTFFDSASKVLQGPALLVNYSNLAWLHHERGEPALSQDYLQRVEELSKEYITERDHPFDNDHTAEPTEEPLHPEVLAEKAWTLMNMGPQQNRVAADLFEQALMEQPERVEWRTSQAIALMSACKHNLAGVNSEVLQKVQRAHQENPEDMYLHAEYLRQRSKKKEQVEEEVAELMSRIVEIARGSYSGLKSGLRYYRLTDDMDVGISWAEKALEKHPDSRFVKRCAALCYKWRIVHDKDGPPQRRLLEKGVSLLKEVISLYPDTALVKEMDLADLYGKFDCAKAEDMYNALFQRQMEPQETQLVYNRYAKYLQINLCDHRGAIRYHQKAALINHDSFFRGNSTETLQKLSKSSPDVARPEIQRSFLSTRLEELQCHFTWEMERSCFIRSSVKDKLEDLRTDESSPWRGQIYNLLGFLQSQLDHSDDALSLFTSASDSLSGPALLVNYSDLAWLHHDRGELALSQDYLQRVEELHRDYPTERDHPEVLAEKAFSLMHFDNDLKRVAVKLWERALQQVSRRVEWRSAQALALLSAQRSNVSEELFTKIREASERDPENLQLRAEYLDQCVRRGQEVGPEAAALADQVLLHPDRIHRDIKSLLELYRRAVSVDAAIDLAVKALDKQPNSRYLKACLAMCYKWRIMQREASQELIERGVTLLSEVISLYPDSCFRMEIDLANTCAKSPHNLTHATHIYEDLLHRDLEPVDRQILYNCYAKFLKYDKKDYVKSTEYHMKAAEIPIRSYFRANSIEILQRLRPRNNSLRSEVEQFLSCLQDS